jgi:hypothetical protein
MTWRVEDVPQLRGFEIEWVEPGLTLLSRKNRLYKAETPTSEREFIGEITSSGLKQIAANMRLGQRLGRFMVYNAIPLADGTIFVTFDKQIGLISNGRYQPLAGLTRPFRVLRGACAIGKDGAVYFGEYLDNAERGPMNLYKYVPGSEGATLVHTFAAGEVRHIHGVYTDPFTDSLWCVTGDGPSESKILRTCDGFQSLETIGEGDESWRTVSLLFTSDAITYASDAEFNENHIYRLHRSTGERHVLGEIDGPVYYSHAIGDDLFFAVTAELSPSQKRPVATVWHVSDDGKISSVYSVEKDLFQNKTLAEAFLHGMIHFPAGEANANDTYFHGVALRGIDNRTLRLFHD